MATKPQDNADGRAEAPFVLVENGAKGTRITAANGAAFGVGARLGQALSDARAVFPGLRAEPADPGADAELLEGLARWAMRYSPIVALDGTDGLMIDTTGCEHLFGGEAKLVADCLKRLRAAGFAVAAGMAGTPALAWALARFGEEAAIAGPGETPARMKDLPVAALRLSRERRTLLKRLGLKTIGALAAVPRAALERRFRSREAAQSVQLRLDQMMGTLDEPLVPLYPPPPCRAFLAVNEPVIDIGGVEIVVEDLLVRICHRLVERGEGARLFRLTAFRADGGSSTLLVRLSRPGRAREAIMRLFAERLEEIDCGFGIDGFALSAEDLSELSQVQTALAAEEAGDGAQSDPRVFCDGIAPLVDTLANRLGAHNVHQWAPVESHVPERAVRRVAVGGALAWQQWQERASPAPRPFRLFDRPEAVEVTAEVPDGPPMQFTWRRVRRLVTRASGPERIAPEWWRADARGVAVRDYFVVEDGEGRQYWLYREGGYACGEPAHPRWYLHGLFA
ncbi:Y-family DNA polymerase [Pararhizobium mangrovi]|nr:DNA polymerase Y family protein [Pararhizobium mangrovi]